MSDRTLYVSVVRQSIQTNERDKKETPPIRVSRGKHGPPQHVSRLEVKGTVRVIYDPQHPTPWGARVWLEIDEDQ